MTNHGICAHGERYRGNISRRRLRNVQDCFPVSYVTIVCEISTDGMIPCILSPEMRPSTLLFAFRNFRFLSIVLTLNFSHVLITRGWP